MKRYTVKQVVRLENQAEHLNIIKQQRLDELYSAPLVGLAAMGLVCTMSYFKAGNETILPLILGSVATLSGGAGLTYLFSVDQIRGNLREKINNIYDVMGENFKSDVKEEQLRQKYGYDEEENTKTR